MNGPRRERQQPVLRHVRQLVVFPDASVLYLRFYLKKLAPDLDHGGAVMRMDAIGRRAHLDGNLGVDSGVIETTRTDGRGSVVADPGIAMRRVDAMQDPATFALFRDLGADHSADLPAVALCATVLAGVRDERPEHPARTLGAPSLEAVEQAPMKPLRFRRLIAADAPQDRLIALRRAVAIADGKLNVRELAAACLDWSEDRQRRWIFEYYAASRAAPGGDAETEKTEETAA